MNIKHFILTVIACAMTMNMMAASDNQNLDNAMNNNENKTLVAYFSATGTTMEAATKLAKVIHADVHEIIPEVPYTSADLNWNNKNSRSSIEMANKSSRPAVASKVENMAQYDTVFVGFPIWWYIAPTIINTFLEQYDMAGKTIVPFFTSGGSGAGETLRYLKPSAPDANWVEPKNFNYMSESDIITWTNSLQ